MRLHNIDPFWIEFLQRGLNIRKRIRNKTLIANKKSDIEIRSHHAYTKLKQFEDVGA